MTFDRKKLVKEYQALGWEQVLSSDGALSFSGPASPVRPLPIGPLKKMREWPEEFAQKQRRGPRPS